MISRKMIILKSEESKASVAKHFANLAAPEAIEATNLAAQEIEDENTWRDLEQLLNDQISEIRHKWTSIDDEIWAKVVCLERNRRIAKAYARSPVISITGAESEFDGSRIGLNAFPNARRDRDTERLKRQIKAGFKLKIDQRTGNVFIKRVGKCAIFVCPATDVLSPGIRRADDRIRDPIAMQSRCIPSITFRSLEPEKPIMLFDMDRFLRMLAAETRPRPAYPSIAVLDRFQPHCMHLIQLVSRAESSRAAVLQHPCWLVLLNVVALDLLWSRFGHPHLVQLNHNQLLNIRSGFANSDTIGGDDNGDLDADTNDDAMDMTGRKATFVNRFNRQTRSGKPQQHSDDLYYSGYAAKISSSNTSQHQQQQQQQYQAFDSKNRQQKFPSQPLPQTKKEEKIKKQIKQVDIKQQNKDEQQQQRKAMTTTTMMMMMMKMKPNEDARFSKKINNQKSQILSNDIDYQRRKRSDKVTTTANGDTRIPIISDPSAASCSSKSSTKSNAFPSFTSSSSSASAALSFLSYPPKHTANFVDNNNHYHRNHHRHPHHAHHHRSSSNLCRSRAISRSATHLYQSQSQIGPDDDEPYHHRARHDHHDHHHPYCQHHSSYHHHQQQQHPTPLPLLYHRDHHHHDQRYIPNSSPSPSLSSIASSPSASSSTSSSSSNSSSSSSLLSLSEKVNTTETVVASAKQAVTDRKNGSSNCCEEKCYSHVNGSFRFNSRLYQPNHYPFSHPTHPPPPPPLHHNQNNNNNNYHHKRYYRHRQSSSPPPLRATSSYGCNLHNLHANENRPNRITTGKPRLYSRNSDRLLAMKKMSLSNIELRTNKFDDQSDPASDHHRRSDDDGYCFGGKSDENFDTNKTDSNKTINEKMDKTHFDDDDEEDEEEDEQENDKLKRKRQSKEMESTAEIRRAQSND